MNVVARMATLRESSPQTPRRRHRPDYWLPMIATGLLCVGLVVVYAISPGMSALKGVSDSYYISKQLIAILLGVAAFIVMSRIPYAYWRTAVKPHNKPTGQAVRPMKAVIAAVKKTKHEQPADKPQPERRKRTRSRRKKQPETVNTKSEQLIQPTKTQGVIDQTEEVIHLR